MRIARGASASTPAFAREVFKEALKWGAGAVMVAHNHPSGDRTPSAADLRFTERLIELARLAEIRLLDHLVLGDNSYTSIRSIDAVTF